MTHISWHERFDTGIEVIDFQHQKIVSMINDLHAAATEHEYTATREILSRMRQYVEEHFTFEEELLREAAYQYTDTHIKLHQRFLERLDNLSQRYEEGENVRNELSRFLTKWLTHHIGHEDQDYVADVKRIMQDICS